MNEETFTTFIETLKTLPPSPTVTFRGYIDHTIMESRPIITNTVTATSHNISIATNNLEKPEVAIFIGSNGRDLAPYLKGSPSFNLQEVTFLPNTYFYQHPLREFLGVTIQLYEEAVLTEDGKGLTPARKLDSWNPIIIKFEPALRSALSKNIELPEGASERFFSPMQ